MLTLQSALEQLEKCSERKFDYSMDHTAQAASTILEVMNRYAAKAVDKLPESFSMSDMSIVLSAFSSFVCMDNTFRYNYGFFQNRIEDYHRYLYSQCVRLDMIVKHYNAVSKCWNLSDVALVYDESYIFECECDEDFVLSLDRRHFVRLYKKEDDNVSLTILKKDEQAVKASFELKPATMLDAGSVSQLCDSLELLGLKERIQE